MPLEIIWYFATVPLIIFYEVTSMKKPEEFLRGLEEVIPESEIEKLIKPKKPLKIKFGADPSAPDLHLGHMVVLKKLRFLQELGHTIVFLIGDFTAMIGDPTGKSETRKSLSLEQIKKNAQTYQDQVFKILDKSKTEVVFNSDWLDNLSSKELIALSGKYTVARMLERDDFNKRFKQNQSISIHEFLYPLLQGYDSVALESDVEIGGTDQKFNLLMGRHLQQIYGKKQQIIITAPILEGLDGVQKMSKSLKNHIGIMEDPKEIFGKLMSLPDNLIIRYFNLLSDKDKEYIEKIDKDMKTGALNPKHAKEEFAVEIITFLHSKESAEYAKNEFNLVFSKKENPTDMQELWAAPNSELRLDEFIINNKIINSKKEISRLIKQGAVNLDGNRVDDIFYKFIPSDEQVLKIGKRKFYKIMLKP
jgi:tyrosyl-tRNA synthetase